MQSISQEWRMCKAVWHSRHLTDSSDWKLHPDIFLSLEDLFGPFSIDLITSRTNHQLPVHCSWRQDPAAVAVDGLVIPWKDHYPYMFPPFALIPHCLGILELERAQAVLIDPVWLNQVWYPQLHEFLINIPILLPPIQDVITSPEGHSHPMVRRNGHLPLAAWPVSGDHVRQRDFLTELSTLSGAPGENRQNFCWKLWAGWCAEFHTIGDIYDS